MKIQFYTFPESQFTVNVDHVLSFGKYKTYTDSQKTNAIELFMVKMRLTCKNGHPYSKEITERECEAFRTFLAENEIHQVVEV